MVEKLLEQKEKRDSEFRDETRESFRIVFNKIDSLTAKLEKQNTKQVEKTARIDGKLFFVVAIISSGISFIAKKLGF